MDVGRVVATRALLAALFAALLTWTAGAEEAVPLSAEEHADWTAIGRVNVGGLNTRGTCTGTLIAPDLVLTAAHCIPPRALREDTPEKVHFLAGWFRDSYAGHQTVREVILHPEYVRGRQSVGRLHTDVALLVLDGPLTEVRPLPIGRLPGFADDVEVLAYSNRRNGALARTGPCVAVQVDPDTLGTTCPVVSGNSGAPLLRPGTDGWRVVAVTVATVGGPSGFHSFAVRAAPVLFELAGRDAPP